MYDDIFKPKFIVITFNVNDLHTPNQRHHLPAGSKIGCLSTRMNTHMHVKHTHVFRKGEGKVV